MDTCYALAPGAFGRFFFVKMSSHPEVDSRPASPWLWHVVCWFCWSSRTSAVFVDCPHAGRGERGSSGRAVWRSVLGRCFDCVDSPSSWHLESGHYIHEPCVSGSQCSLFEFCFRRFFLCQKQAACHSRREFLSMDSAQGFPPSRHFSNSAQRRRVLHNDFSDVVAIDISLNARVQNNNNMADMVGEARSQPGDCRGSESSPMMGDLRFTLRT